MLSRPSSRLRPPPTPSQPPRHFPALGYRRASLPEPQTRGRGGSPLFPCRPSDRSMSPNAGRFLGTRSRFLGAVRGLRPRVAGSAPPWPRLSPRVHLRRHKLRFRYGPVRCSPSYKDLVAPLRRSGSPPPPGASYRGPWRLPGPDFHRLASMSFAASVVTYVIATPSTLVAPTGVSAHRTTPYAQGGSRRDRTSVRSYSERREGARIFDLA